MANAYKVLGQLNPSANTASTLYTVPAATQTVASTLSVCNLGISATTYRVSVRVNGASAANTQYVVYDACVNPNDTAFLTLGMSLGTADVITVYAGTANVAFNLFGTEIS